MMISFDNAPFLDRETNQPVEGRIRVYLHDSDNLAEIFTLEGAEYVRAENPQLLHAGYPDASLFAEIGVYDICVDKYIGPYGQMSVDSPESDFAQINEYEFGIDFDLARSTAIRVDTVSDLRDVDPSVGCVNVMWYAVPGDCFQRTYIWDADCQNEEDGGYVVRSDVSDTGRWVLMWDDEVLPCTFYGVRPGVETNMNMLLDYPDVVGSFSLVTAPCVRFVRGTYTAEVDYITDKQLCFDTGAKFTDSKFTCPSARTFGRVSDFIADFEFTDPCSVAYSSWFRSATAFFTCKAGKLVVDKSNLVDKVIRAEAKAKDCTIVYETNIRLPLTYVNNGHITLERVNLDGIGMFDSTDKVTFRSMTIRDQWWSDPASVDWVNNVNARSTGLVTLLLANFKSTEAYINAVVANGGTMVDLAGRHVTTWNNSSITDIRNLYCDSLSVHVGNNDVNLSNVHASELYMTCGYLTVRDSELNFGAEPSIGWVDADRCRITSSIGWTNHIGMEVQNSFWGVGLDYAQDNVTDHGGVIFKNCTFKQNVSLKLKRLSMYRCITDNNLIQVYPYKDGDTYYLTCTLEDNSFNSASPVEFTKLDTVNGNLQEDVYDCHLVWRILNNSFAGNSEGLRMRYWQYRTGNYGGRTFVAPGSANHSVAYGGNTGNCPADTARGMFVSDNTDYVTEAVGDYTLYKYSNVTRRAMPVFGSFWWDCDTPAGKGLLTKWYNAVETPYDSLSYDMFVQTAWYLYPRAHEQALVNGDFFDMALCVFGDYIRIVQQGSNDHNSFIHARVV